MKIDKRSDKYNGHKTNDRLNAFRKQTHAFTSFTNVKITDVGSNYLKINDLPSWLGSKREKCFCLSIRTCKVLMAKRNTRVR